MNKYCIFSYFVITYYYYCEERVPLGKLTTTETPYLHLYTKREITQNNIVNIISNICVVLVISFIPAKFAASQWSYRKPHIYLWHNWITLSGTSGLMYSHGHKQIYNFIPHSNMFFTICLYTKKLGNKMCLEPEF